MELIARTHGSTATSLPWLPKTLVYISFPLGIISVNLSLLGQVPRKVYDIIHGTEHNELAEELAAKAAALTEELEAEEAKVLSADNPEN